MGGKRNLGRYLLGSSVIALVAASGSSASAETNEQLAAQLKAMQAQIEHLQRQIEQNNQRPDRTEQFRCCCRACRSGAIGSGASGCRRLGGGGPSRCQQGRWRERER